MQLEALEWGRISFVLSLRSKISKEYSYWNDFAKEDPKFIVIRNLGLSYGYLWCVFTRIYSSKNAVKLRTETPR